MQARGPGDTDDVELWALLDIDPYYELRLLGSEAAGAGERAPVPVPAPAVARLLADDEAREALSRESRSRTDRFSAPAAAAVYAERLTAALAKR
jgi:hypothetical protein